LLDFWEREFAADGRKIWAVGFAASANHMTARALSSAEKELLARGRIAAWLNVKRRNVEAPDPTGHRIQNGLRQSECRHTIRRTGPDQGSDLVDRSAAQRSIVYQRWPALSTFSAAAMT
jgi:hypothetical protein